MKNKKPLLVFIIALLLARSVYTQNETKVTTVMGEISVVNHDLIKYKSFLDTLDNSVPENIPLALKYFKNNLLYLDDYEKDIAALMFEKYYTGYYDVYINNEGNTIGIEDTDSQIIKSINDNLKNYGLRLSQISEGDDLYIMPLPGFLYTSFDDKVSSVLSEYFRLDSIACGLGYIFYNNGEVWQYACLLEKLIVGIEHYFFKFSPPITNDFLNSMYFRYMYDYIGISNNFGLSLDFVIHQPNITLYETYRKFIGNHPKTISAKFISSFVDLIDKKGELPKLKEFFYSYENNEYGILELRKELDFKTLLQDFNEYVKNN